MATAAPPSPGKKKKAPAPPPSAEAAPKDTRHWMEKLNRSGYLVGAILLHLLIFLIVATWVVFQAPKPPADDFTKTYVPSAPPPPPPPPQQQETMKLPSHIAPAPTAIIAHNNMPTFSVPLPNLNPSVSIDPMLNNTVAPHSMSTADHLAARLPLIKAMETQSWHRSQENIEDSNGDPHNVVATFPVYLASYADGDWGCNVTLNNGAIEAGSLPDLVAKMNEWSHANLKGTVVPTPLDIGGPDLMAKKPPFIFFTGHKDFILTDQEVANLQEYLQNGGAIWGDNCLPGFGSRFDVAFRREMKRVVPDLDKQFQKVPMDYDIFTKSWFNLTKLPLGMNFYGEPIEHLDLDGKLAILYTPNDYSDLMTMRILPGDTTMEGTNPKFGSGSPLYTFGSFWYNSSIFFRNYTLPSCLDAHRMGMNIIGYLLVRFDKDLLLAP
jgi:hypothetical protein